MTIKPLPQEIWQKIIALLKVDPPAVLSSPPRTAMYQPDLVVIMTVCKLFEGIVEPLLYKHLLCDSFPLLIKNNWKRSSSSKRRFGHVTSLNIEYCTKGNGIEPTYVSLLDGGGANIWSKIGCAKAAQGLEDMLMDQCRREADEILEALTKIEQRGLKKIFPNLDRIAFGAIYGRQTNIWQRYDEWHLRRGVPSSGQQCGRLLAGIAGAKTLLHLCIRDASGPYCLPPFPPLFKSLKPKANYSRTIHFGFTKGTDVLCSAPGFQIEWIGDTSPQMDLANTFYSLYCEIIPMSATIGRRRADGEIIEAGDVTIFASSSKFTPTFLDKLGPSTAYRLAVTAGYAEGMSQPGTRILTPDEQWRIVMGMGLILQVEYRRQSKGKDSICWKPLSDAPKCRGCGSVPSV